MAGVKELATELIDYQRLHELTKAEVKELILPSSRSKIPDGAKLSAKDMKVDLTDLSANRKK